MTLQTAQYTVGTAAVQIISSQNNPTQVLLHNAEKQTTHYIYLGGSSSVTTETGIHMDGSDNYQIVLQPGSSLWAIAASNYDLHVMWQVL
jgi:hypothetical protein